MTNGSRLEVNETGTSLYYQPGLLIGGQVEHECNLSRGIGYYLEFLLMLAPFCKSPLNATLRGVTNNREDPSVDLVKASAFPVLKRYFLIDEGLEMKVVKRGAAPGGGGQVLFKCPIRKSLKAQQVTDQGKIKRIRGVAWAARVSPAVANRMVESAKGILLKLLPDVYIYTDHTTGARSGKSPGFGLTLTAETTSGCWFSAEEASKAARTENEGPSVPEDVGKQAAYALLEEIYRGGCVDSTSQCLQLLLMTLSQQDVSKVVTGPLSDYTVSFLRLIRDMFGTTFKLEEHKVEGKTEMTFMSDLTFFAETDDGEVLRMGASKVKLTCVGTGFSNLSKRTA